MDENRWSDTALREYVRRVHNHNWFDDSVGDDREVENERFRREVRSRIVGAVQASLLERIGTLSDPEGIALVAEELVDDCCREDERRWLLVSPEPWAYLADWVSTELVRSYRNAAGARKKDGKAVKRLERSARANN